MAVYVDDMNLQAGVPDGRRAVRARWNHLFADSEDALRAFAAKIGLKAEWIQARGGRHAHFDVTAGKRQQAIAQGAKAVTWREAGEFFARQAFEEQRERKAQREAKPVRHSWAADGVPPGNVKICRRDGCAMVAERRPHSTEKRWITIYSKGGRRIISGRVPRCGSELPQVIRTEEMAHLAEAADRQAAAAYRQGDLDRAFRLLTDARVPDPGHCEPWDSHEQRIRDAARRRQAETPGERPATGSPEVQEEIQKIHEWNARLPEGFCDWPTCPEHGEKTIDTR